MKKYSKFIKHGLEPEWCNWEFIANNEESKHLLEKASEFLHWFGESTGGKKRKRQRVYIGLDSDIMALNKIMHIYQDVKVAPEHFKDLTGFDYRIIVATQKDGDELLEMSKYLREFREKKKGKGTNKPGSVVYVTLEDNEPNIGLEALKNIDPTKIIIKI